MKKYLLFLGLPMLPLLSTAQSAHVPVDEDAVYLIRRLSTLTRSLNQNSHTTVQPLLAKDVAAFMEQSRLHNLAKGWGQTDNSNISLVLSNTGEWAQPDGAGAIDARRPLGPFYQKMTDMLYLNNRRFFMSVNPMLGLQGMYENFDEETDIKFNWTAGARIRAKYKNYLGLDFKLQYISEQPAKYYHQLNQSRNTVIGGTRNFDYNRGNQRYGYVLPTGSISASVLKDYVSLNVGYDYFKIGQGQRGLMLSDFSGPVGFANLRTKVWQLQYDNVFLRLSPDRDIPGSALTANAANYKFAAAHQLSANINKWLNIGLYEMVVFSRNEGFELSYLNPVIFYRAMERSLGSPDKVAIGLNASAIPVKKLRLYGQFFINEFIAKEFFGSNKYMHNKWGAQLGFNYYDVFNVSNLDLQLEGNVIRPYTFQHTFRGTEYIPSNFTNNNLPLGHPLGAGFRELLAIVRYQPSPRLNFEAKMMLYQRGVDTADQNFGNDLSKAYSQNVPNRYGVKMVNGLQLDRTLYSLKAAYQLAPNLFFDLGGVYGRFNYKEAAEHTNHYQFWTGLRLNITARDYTQF